MSDSRGTGFEIMHAASFRERLVGLIGRDESEMTGALLIQPAWLGVHSFGMKFPLDVAFLDTDLRVIKTALLKPRRLAFCLQSRAVLEARQGSFQKWGISTGFQVQRN